MVQGEGGWGGEVCVKGTYAAHAWFVDMARPLLPQIVRMRATPSAHEAPVRERGSTLIPSHTAYELDGF